MLYLIQTFALLLLVALVGGLAVGWVTSDKEDEGPSALAAAAMIAFALMVVAAALKWVPGRPGLWLDTAVLFIGAYLIGCVVGAFLRVFTDKVEDSVGSPLGDMVGAATSTAGAVKAVAEATGSVARLGGDAAERRNAAAVAATPAPPPSAAEAMAQGTKPAGATAPRAGKPDELELILGIGPQNERKLHELGIFHFDQIAAWTPQEALWVGGYLAFPGRIEREDWIGQAKLLASGGTTAHADKVRRGEISSTPDA
ncbi:hypothetical protein [Phreatobacter sp.]|uniref:hypothetical protein n=1 Tax=Phreatobacter sp. TaxID=1966341 RepID=UPI0022C44589|nr:hypothetical protein [Phreatobacter sp.]MCZ8315439.1 hypothetical protein [Phreatobacter sp.]